MGRRVRVYLRLLDADFAQEETSAALLVFIVYRQAHSAHRVDRSQGHPVLPRREILRDADRHKLDEHVPVAHQRIVDAENVVLQDGLGVWVAQDVCKEAQSRHLGSVGAPVGDYGEGVARLVWPDRLKLITLEGEISAHADG